MCNRKLIIRLLGSLLFSSACLAQGQRADNLVVVVLDGMRWQEVFSGADSAIINNPSFTRDRPGINRKYWEDDATKRREKLFPFIWNLIALKGQVIGNRRLENKVNVLNPFQLTYPGFSEMITGWADPAIISNAEVISHSENVLEYINTQKNYEGRVAVFATSDLFPFLLNKQKSKLYINADTDSFTLTGATFRLLNQMQALTNKPTTERPDLLTYFSAMEYLKANHPGVLYLALGETDAFAHAGNYDQYLETAHAEDKMIGELWHYLQTQSLYEGKTTLLITCDHGRGDSAKIQWKSHGPEIKDSGEIWIAAIGPNIQPNGEGKTKQQVYQAQLAVTMAKILGLSFEPGTHQAMGVIEGLLTK